MALDAICLQSVVRELKSQIVGAADREDPAAHARPDRPAAARVSGGCLLCAGVGQPRLHLTRLLRDNPSQPPMFCMLLRKYLAGGRIAALRQAELERVVELEIEALDELGEQSRFTPDSRGDGPAVQPDSLRGGRTHHRLPAPRRF